MIVGFPFLFQGIQYPHCNSDPTTSCSVIVSSVARSSCRSILQSCLQVLCSRCCLTWVCNYTYTASRGLSSNHMLKTWLVERGFLAVTMASPLPARLKALRILELKPPTMASASHHACAAKTHLLQFVSRAEYLTLPPSCRQAAHFHRRGLQVILRSTSVWDFSRADSTDLCPG